ncbi:uncharacterized protein LOC126320435 [Schistocerca gregaria]|uniref:uncharacterized protein LOC126320435 n=1 Tax=Schistocerca gregaria TaxID=7010 RepID=UPI00211E1E07|nr:uncharacterized protein LOC126320435 [Schistocerca gregaria]
MLQKPGCVVNSDFYKKFWNNLNPACYALALTCKLIGSYIGEEKSTNIMNLIKQVLSNPSLKPDELKIAKLNPQTHNQQSQNLMLNLFFIGSYFTISPKKTCTRALLNLLSYFCSKLSESSSKNLPDILFLRHIEKVYGKVHNYRSYEGLRHSLQLCCFDDGSALNLTFVNLLANQLSAPLVHGVIRNLLKDKDTSLIVFKILLELLRHPSVDENMASTLLYMMHSFIIYTPFSPVSVLDEIRDTIKMFIVWPRPYSDVAKRILDLLSFECRVPGTCFRIQLLIEYPELIPNLQLNGTEFRLDRPERKIHLFFDCNNPDSKRLQALLLYNSPPTLGSVPAFQANILASILHLCIGVRLDSAHLLGAVPSRINEWYIEAMGIVEKSLKYSDEEAKKYYSENLMRLKECISGECPDALTNSKNPFSGLELPPLNIHYVPISLPDTLNLTSNQWINTMNYCACTDIFNNLINILLGHSPLDSRSSSTQNANEAHSFVPIRIALIGGDPMVHHFSSSYLLGMMLRPELFTKLDIQIFYLPICPSELGNWISFQDRWYRKQVAIFYQAIKSIYPCDSYQIGSSTNEKRSSISPYQSPRSSKASATPEQNGKQGSVDSNAPSLEFKKFSPPLLLYQELTHYFREAKWSSTINLFQVECSNNSRTVILTFFSRARLGLPVMIEAFKRNSDLKACTNEEIITSKNFKYTPLNVSMRYVQVNPVGISRTIGSQGRKAYAAIAVASIPNAMDSCVFAYPHPADAWMELILHEDKKKKASNSREDSGKVYHVNQVEIVGSEPFDVLLDDVLYGPFDKLKFKCAKNEKSGKPYSLSFQTFLPSRAK